MTKEEIVAERKNLAEWFAEQQRIFNEKNWFLDAEAERFPEDRQLTAKDVAETYAEIEKPKAVEVLGEKAPIKGMTP